MRKLLLAMAAVALVSGGLATPVSDGYAAKIINDIGDPIDLTLNTGKLIKLDNPANSVFVGNPELADVQVQSPTIIYVFAKRPGKTNLFALDKKGSVLLNSPVQISHDVSSLQQSLRDIDPNGFIKAHSVQEGLILSGRAASASVSSDAQRLAALYAPGGNIVNRIVVEGSQQVNLRVQVAEVARSVTKQLGINWENLSGLGNFSLGTFVGRDIVDATNLITRSGSTSGLFAAFNDGQTSIQGMIDALEDEGLITVLAEPNLTALSGETASFLAGGEFPIPVPQEDGAIAIDYKEFGVSLRFTPNLVGNNRINLQVRPEVSQLSSASAININNIFIQSLLTRRAETTVELASGQSFVLGGLLNSDSDNNVSKTPFLGELPIIGALFRSVSFQRNETELVIIVTPYLVEPTNSRIALPTDGYVPPNDSDLYKDGELMKPSSGENQFNVDDSSKTADAKDVKLIGPAGFIME
ncbi:type II and III secretion system protein family protein [Sneathiella glossodoripedis]|uniref:type II and III secretion system protein family protein n=1 Tax=Sneathiella glossodoripedis TaxID=418853 RepID=UPI00131F183B|nr:type II and III secretion system protein family protein [Sneathiella glossodoripedis]